MDNAFVAAAVQIAPAPARLSHETVAWNIQHAVDYLRRCVDDTGAELIVLPETCSTGFTTGESAELLWELVSDVPGSVSEPIQREAARLGVHVCYGTYERGPRPGIVYNSAALIGPTGDVLGLYRKTHPFTGERADRGGWVTAGLDVCVVETEIANIGMAICFDGDFPELWRVQAVRGAEVICRPSALLRSADIWELTTRARAYDNHTFVIGANAVGLDPAGVCYFGNSMVVSPIADVLARAASHECWVSATIDPTTALASLTPGSSIRQGFDHLAERNLDSYRRYADDLMRPARTRFEHG